MVRQAMGSGHRAWPERFCSLHCFYNATDHLEQVVKEPLENVAFKDIRQRAHIKILRKENHDIYY